MKNELFACDLILSSVSGRESSHEGKKATVVVIEQLPTQSITEAFGEIAKNIVRQCNGKKPIWGKKLFLVEIQYEDNMYVPAQGMYLTHINNQLIGETLNGITYTFTKEEK